MSTPYYSSAHGVIYLGDCLEVMPSLGRCATMLLTDPPYCSGGLHAGDRKQTASDKYSQNGHNPYGEWMGDQKDQRGFAAWYAAVLKTAARRCLFPDAYVFSFTDWRQLPVSTDILQAAGIHWRGVAAWNKGLGSRAPHKGYVRHQAEFLVWGTVGKCPSVSPFGPAAGVMTARVDTRAKLHQCQKPVEVIAEYVQLTAPGSTVLDPFFGSGSTGAACIQTGRKFIGIEESEQHAERAAKRLEALTAA